MAMPRSMIALFLAALAAGGCARPAAGPKAPTGPALAKDAQRPAAPTAPGPLARPTVKPSSEPPPPPPIPPKPAAATETPEAEIARLVRELGDEAWDVREAAGKRLLEIGKPAVAALKEAQASQDMEVSTRSRALLAEIVGQGFLGIQIRDPDDADREGRELPDDGGAVVVETLPETVAARAGLRPGDFLYSIDGRVVHGSAGLVEMVAAMEPGTEIALVLYRNGKREEQRLAVGRRPKSASAPSLPDVPMQMEE